MKPMEKIETVGESGREGGGADKGQRCVFAGQWMKVGNGASEIGGGVGPNNATSPMNEPFFGGSQTIYTFPGCYSGDLSSRKSLAADRRLPQ
jgi:hypothetical protein